MTSSKNQPSPLMEVARLAGKMDNVAIALTNLPAGRQIHHGHKWSLIHPVLEGHRFAVMHIRRGEELLSWGYPFGRALRDIHPGDWIRNESMITALEQRNLPLELPTDSNFEDQPLEQSARLDEVLPAEPLIVTPTNLQFSGYNRGERGFGTRNYVIVLAINSHAGSAAIALASRLDKIARSLGDVDGVVPVAHTEGGGPEQPNNRDLLLRTLVGFLVHPNVASAIVLDHPAGAVRWSDVTACNEAKTRKLERMPLVVSIADDPVEDKTVLPLLHAAAAVPRCELPLSALNIALQCGGSDAFSGISGNPLAGAVAREVIHAGGSAILAETDELIGAERYVLSSVKDRSTAAAFLKKVERFKAWTASHGQSAASNPSGGNKLRGLYNITLKSIGAAAKKAPDVPLASVVDYADRITEPGLHFMDSPGNDLESVAGQVASGSNLIFFVTGNGSITNFPFVPTLKFVTTTPRYQLMPNEMDVNAGRYLDGTPMNTLTKEVLQQVLRVASGERTRGELAGHSQVSIWRNWAVSKQLENYHSTTQTDISHQLANSISKIPALDQTAASLNDRHRRLSTIDWPTTQPRIGLIAPTSLCSGQVAGLIAAKIDKHDIVTKRLSKVVALPHTEGCGSGGSDDLYTRTLVGHVLHPAVATALLLEHGCERTHNDYFRAAILESGQSIDHFGWASIQLDGGIAAVTEKVADHFVRATEDYVGQALPRATESPTIGIIVTGSPSSPLITDLLANLTVELISDGGSVIAPAIGPTAVTLATAGLVSDCPLPTVHFADQPSDGGLHLMATPTTHVDEIVGGLAAAGAELIVSFSPNRPIHAHPFVPVLQITEDTITEGFDLVITEASSPENSSDLLANRVAAALSGNYVPAQLAKRAVAFQLTRGIVGISL